MLLAEGDRVPADAVLLPGSELTLDESLLTGESVPVFRTCGGAEADAATLRAGSLVIKGQGRIYREPQTHGKLALVLAAVLTQAGSAQQPTPLAAALDTVQMRNIGPFRSGAWVTAIAVPDAPLCRHDCPGLCPQCGADLAKAPCGCNAVKKDDRWAALDALRDQLPPG